MWPTVTAFKRIESQKEAIVAFLTQEFPALLLGKAVQLNDGSASTYRGLIRRHTEVPSSTVKWDAQNFRQDTAYQAETDAEITRIRLRLKQSGEMRPNGSCVLP